MEPWTSPAPDWSSNCWLCALFLAPEMRQGLSHIPRVCLDHSWLMLPNGSERVRLGVDN